MTYELRKKQLLQLDRLIKRQISSIQKDLVKSLKKTISASGIQFYPSKLVDMTETDGSLKLARLSTPLKLKLPIPDGNEDDKGFVEVEFLTKSGYVSDSYGGGTVTEDWECIPIENLVEFVTRLSLHLLKTEIKKKN